MKQNIKRIFAALMAITTIFSLSLGVFAATTADATIDFTKTGSIEIFKYDLTQAMLDDTTTVNGSSLNDYLSDYTSDGVDNQALREALSNPDTSAHPGSENPFNKRLGNMSDKSNGYAIKGVEFSYLKIADICTYSEIEADGVHRSMVLYKMDDAKDAALLSALGLTNSDAYPVVASYAETGYHFFQSDTLIDALSTALLNSTNVKNALERYMYKQEASKFSLTDEDGHTEVLNLPLGLYLVVETKVPEMVTNTTAPFFVSVPMTTVNGTISNNGGEEWLYDVTLFPKNETGIPTLEKTVREANTDTGKNNGLDAVDDGYAHNATASTGDKVEYQLTGRLPTITSSATALTDFSWKDFMCPGLNAFNVDPVAEEAGLLNGHYNPNDVEIHFYLDAEMTEEITGWKLNDETPKFFVECNKNNMDVIILEAGLNEINSSTAVHDPNYSLERGYSNCYYRVTYSATLKSNDTVVFGDDGNWNLAELSWKRTTGNYSDTIIDDAHVYSYVLEVKKEFSDGRGDVSKVNFKVQNTTDNYWLVARQEGDGLYFVTGHVADEADATTFIPNSSTGVLTIKGVEDDTYVLTEIQTDNGYTLLKDNITVVITAEEDEDRLCDVYDGNDYVAAFSSTGIDQYGVWQNKYTDEIYNETPYEQTALAHYMLTASATVDSNPVTMQAVNDSANALVPLTVINTRGPELPKTGDNGVWMYGVIGFALVAACGGVLFLAFRKRKPAEDK